MNNVSSTKYFSPFTDLKERNPLSSFVTKRTEELTTEVQDQLNEKTNYNSIFSLVRKVVKMATGNERVGIGLALADLPPQLGAYWEVGGNFIIMNENLLFALKAAKRPVQEVNSFIFVILMHEYLHSVGYLDENYARDLTSVICANVFSKDHPAYALATADPWKVYPFLMRVPPRGNGTIRIVPNFDTDSTPYIM